MAKIYQAAANSPTGPLYLANNNRKQEEHQDPPNKEELAGVFELGATAYKTLWAYFAGNFLTSRLAYNIQYINKILSRLLGFQKSGVTYNIDGL